MRPPKHIRFGAFTYAVKTNKAAQTHLAAEGLLGKTRHTRQHLLIGTRQHAEQVRDTLLHECLHVVANQTATLKNSVKQEDLILRWTPVLIAMLRDNPELVDYLVQ